VTRVCADDYRADNRTDRLRLDIIKQQHLRLWRATLSSSRTTSTPQARR
jgi:hypothetical protein